MHSRSALARLQQVTTLVLLGSALAWLTWQWPRSSAIAIAGALAIFFWYSVLLAVEFVLAKIIGRNDPVPAPTATELLRAWWAETWTALTVFCWRQPFRWRAQPDFVDTDLVRGRRGVVLLHGFLCNRGFWNPWMARLRAGGHPFVAVNLEPVFGSIDEYATIIEAAVQHITRATGMPPLIVGHSMGGVAARAWMRAREGASRVHGVVTIATPHRGTWLGRFSHTPNGRQMRLAGGWIGALPDQSSSARFVCWYSNCDNVVIPASTATLPGADNRLVRGAAHVELAFEPRVIAHVLDELRRQG
jgi:pimeloyl-ACP methyl ester carboxylesterase